MRARNRLAVVGAATLAALGLGLTANATKAPSCAASGRLTPICGLRAPEDMEMMPDGRHLVLSEMHDAIGHLDGYSGISLVDLRSGKVRHLAPVVRAEAGWGDPACSAPSVTETHGLHLSRRADGRLLLLAVNHAGRESIEMYEVVEERGGYGLAWHGCVQQREKLAFNDVAATATGFVASIPDAKLPENAGKPLPLDGRNTGYLVEWTPGAGLVTLPDTRGAYDNGVQLSADGRFVYFAAWTGREVVKYDRATRKIVGKARLDFHPDNLTMRADGGIVAAGVADISSFGDCFQAHDRFCPSGFGVAAIDPGTMRPSPLFSAPPGLMSGVSVALQAPGHLYIGAFSGDRILKVDLDR